MALPQLPKQFLFLFFPFSAMALPQLLFFLTDQAAFWAEEFR